MSKTKLAFPLTLIAAMLLSGCDGSNATSAEGGGVTPEPGANGAPSKTIGYYLTLSTGTETGTLNSLGDDFRSKPQTFNGGVNQNLIFDNSGAGTLFAVGNVTPSGATAAGSELHVLKNVTTRGSAAFADGGANGDLKVVFSTAVTTPKGLTAIGTSVATATKFVIADSSGTNAFHVVTKPTASGSAVAPVVSFTAANVGGNAWDTAYDSKGDRLFVALTAGTNAGTVAVYDAFSTLTASKAPDRVITPGKVDNKGTPNDATDDVSSKVSTNLHGIAYDATANLLVLSDVGASTTSTQTGFDTDGSLYVIASASTAKDTTAAGAGSVAATATKATFTGSNTMLGNPVDLVISGRDAIVAEKANGGGFNLLRFENVFSAVGGNVAPTVVVVGSSTAGKPESITLAK